MYIQVYNKDLLVQLERTFGKVTVVFIESRPGQMLWWRHTLDVAFWDGCLVHTLPVFLDVIYQHLTCVDLKVHKRSCRLIDCVGKQLPRWREAVFVVSVNFRMNSSSADSVRTSIVFSDKLMKQKTFLKTKRYSSIAWCWCVRTHKRLY